MTLQDFDQAPTERGTTAGRVGALRALFDGLGIDAVIVPHADAYRNEYLPPDAERLAWLTGFTGSAGTALVTRDQALLFTDGRYTVQAGRQLDPSMFAVRDIGEGGLSDWIREHVGEGQRVGVDPWLHTRGEIERLEAASAHAGAALVSLRSNPIDRLWQDRPASRPAKTVVHPPEFAGRSTAEKLDDVRRALASARADALAVAEPEAVSWLFNIRGNDVAHTPMVLSRALVPKQGRAVLFADPARLGPQVRLALAPACEILPEGELSHVLSEQAQGRRVLIDPERSPAGLAALVEDAGGTVVAARDPTVLGRAIKNATEIEGARTAHRRDGLAMVRFLAWFDRTAADGSVDEIAAATMLERFRAETGALTDIAFDTIMGSGPHGALPHYRVTRETNRRIAPGEPVVVDSGAQYRDGTTDITRTLVAGGAAETEFRRQFTRVLKGHIAIAAARFPEGATGAQLDPFARAALWQAGFEFAHGTGHGVGSYLSVHEGPQRISRLGHEPLKPGMIVSNEPGYYREGAWGIRIENLVLVREAMPIAGGDLPMHWFETLTLAPIDTRLVLPWMLTSAEIAWLDSYHARVMGTFSGDLDAADRDWLAAQTRPLA